MKVAAERGSHSNIDLMFDPRNLPENVLTKDVPISMEVISDGIARIDFHFGPHRQQKSRIFL